MILLIVVFAVLMIIGAPVGLSLLGSSVAYLVASGYSLQQAFQAFTSAISNSFTLIAVPFFILAGNIMNNGIYHIKDNKIYKMSLNEPMRKIGTVASDEVIMSIIDTVTEYMYCNYGDCCMKDDITWGELQKVRNEIKSNAMEMIKTNLDLKLTTL